MRAVAAMSAALHCNSQVVREDEVRPSSAAVRTQAGHPSVTARAAVRAREKKTMFAEAKSLGMAWAMGSELAMVREKAAAAERTLAQMERAGLIVADWAGMEGVQVGEMGEMRQLREVGEVEVVGEVGGEAEGAGEMAMLASVDWGIRHHHRHLPHTQASCGWSWIDRLRGVRCQSC